MTDAEYNKIKELAFEMGEESSFGYSHAFSILSKLNEWQKQQIMKDAVELTITNTSFIPLPKLDIKAGDKVKIIITKTEQQ